MKYIALVLLMLLSLPAEARKYAPYCVRAHTTRSGRFVRPYCKSFPNWHRTRIRNYYHPY